MGQFSAEKPAPPGSTLSGNQQVYAFACRVGRHEHVHIGIEAEERLKAAAFVTVGAAVDGHDGIGIAEYSSDPRLKVIQRVAMFGENDDLALPPRCVAHFGIVLKDFGELIPFAILPGGDNGLGLILEPLQDADLGLKLDDGLCGGRVVDQVFFQGFLLFGA